MPSAYILLCLFRFLKQTTFFAKQKKKQNKNKKSVLLQLRTFRGNSLALYLYGIPFLANKEQLKQSYQRSPVYAMDARLLVCQAFYYSNIQISSNFIFFVLLYFLAGSILWLVLLLVSLSDHKYIKTVHHNELSYPSILRMQYKRGMPAPSWHNSSKRNYRSQRAVERQQDSSDTQLESFNRTQLN